MFKEILTPEAIKNLYESIDTTILLPKGGNNPLGVLTSDGRPCITPPTQDPIPGTLGAPPEPNYDGSASKGNNANGTANKDVDANYTNVKSVDQNNTPTNKDAMKELNKLEKDNPSLADKLENGKGLNAGSDKVTCLMIASQI